MVLKRGAYLLLLAALLLTLLPGPVQADVAGTVALAQVIFDGPLDALGLPVMAHWQSAAGSEVVLVIAPLAELESAGVPFRVLDADAQPGAYYLAHRRPERMGALQPGMFDIGRVLWVDGSRLLVRATQAQAERLIPLGFELQWLGDQPLVLTAPRAAPTAALAHDESLVGEILAQVTERTLRNSVSGLSGETSVIVGGAPYTITTRFTNSGTSIAKATQYTYEQFAALGLGVGYHYWTRSGYSNRNVIGVITGTTQPQEIVLITAHLDSVSNRDTPSNNPAPGADDNASGSAAVLLAADILSRYYLDRTVRFVLFTGEEQGLLGSYEYANMAANAGDNIVAVYNMDMLAWDAIGGPDLDLFTRTTSNPGYAGDIAIANTFVSIVNTYNLSLTPNIRRTGMGSSDHYPFWVRGFPAILAIEDYTGGDFNTHYHRSTDRLQHFNMPYYVNFVKASMGTAARLAGVTRRYPFTVTTKAEPATVLTEETLTYTVTLTNTALAPTTGMVVSAALPAGTSFLGASAGGVLEGDKVYWRDHTLTPGATATLTYQVQVGCVPSGTLLVGGATHATASGWPIAVSGAPAITTVTALLPEAAFDLTQPVIRAYPALFSNASSHAAIYLWDFGDGVTSTLAAPTHTYTTTGAFTATLTASNACFTDVASRQVMVDDYAVALTLVSAEGAIAPGAAITYTLRLTNTGTLSDSFALQASDNGWLTTLSTSNVGPLSPGAGAVFSATVTAPPDATPGSTHLVTVTATSMADPRPLPASATAQLRALALRVLYLPLLLLEFGGAP